MQQHYTFKFFLRNCLFVILTIGLGANLKSQSAILSGNSDTGLNWKEPVVMEQIIQTELDETNQSLGQTTLTDWSLALLTAYKSLLTYTRSEMTVDKDMSLVLDKAYDWIKTESVPDKPAREMVLDDMNAKKTELILKLTFN